MSDRTTTGRTARPTLRLLQASDETASRLAKIPRSAQPGDVPLPRAVLYRTDLKPTARLVAAWLYDHCAPGTHIATGAQTTIAADLGMTDRTVRTALDALWRAHVLMSVEQRRKRGGGYYLAYGMRAYPLDTPRRRRKPRLSTARPARTARTEPPARPTCARCGGTGWERCAEISAVRRCADCYPPRA